MSTVTDQVIEIARERISGDNYWDLLLHLTATRDTDNGVTDTLLAFVPVSFDDDGTEYDDTVPLLSLDGMRRARELLDQIITTAEAYEAEANAYNEGNGE